MDRNQLIGLTLISFIFIIYAQFFTPKPSPQPTNSPQVAQPVTPADSAVDSDESNTPLQALSTHPSSRNAANPTQYGVFAPAIQGTPQEVTLENEMIQVTLTSQGGRVKKVVLKKYTDHRQQPLVLLDEKSSNMGFQFYVKGNPVHTSALFFDTTDKDQQVSGNSTATASFLLPVGPEQYLRHTFSLPGEGYALTHTWEMVGLSPHIDQEGVQFVWRDLVKRTEKDLKACRNKTTINYYSPEGKFAHLKERTDQKQEQSLPTPLQWVSVKQRFFTAAIIAQEAFQKGYLATTPTPQSTTTVKEAQIHLQLPSREDEQDYQGTFTLYFGPNDYPIMSKIAPGFSKNITLGWPIVRWINRFLIIPVFTFLEQYISNYGIIIILLVIFIKILLLPLSYKSYTSMGKMKVLKPAIDAIKAKHGEDMQKIQMEQMSLYREVGINPLSGCIPVLLQMPILLAMFNFFPNAIALRQQSFLWAHDLSTYDAVIQLPFTIPAYGSHVSLFTLLMTGSTILYTWSNNQLTPPQEGPMKLMTYMMPLTFMFILNSFPAGLSFYYFVSNLVTFGQQSLIKWFVDEEKLKKQLEENKTKNKDRKKSRFQLRLEEAMKAGGNKKTNAVKKYKPSK